MKKFLAQTYIWFLLALLYAPLILIAIFSFTESRVLGSWTGFSTQLYANLFSGEMQESGSLLAAVENTLLIAVISATVSMVLGTIAAIGIHNLQGRKKQAVSFLNNIPMINPDVITGVSLFLLFVFLHISQGYLTVILAHISFGTPYVVLSVLPKLQQMNPNIYEAALDLGASPAYAFRHIVLPEILPGIVTGALFAFTLSVDDFVISFFTTGSGVNNLSILIYSMARRGIHPTINALSTLLFLTVLALLIAVNLRMEKRVKSGE